MSRHVGSDLILPSIVSLAHWVGNANQPGAPPIRTVSTGGNRPFGTHVHPKPSKTIPLNPLPNSGLFHVTMAYRFIL